MNLLIIRHAIAEDKERFAATGRHDDQRPLTEAGRDKMRRAAEGLRTVIPRVAVLASSPLVRARETAEIVAPAVWLARVVIVDALRPDRDVDELLDGLLERIAPNEKSDDERTVAVVGDEPHLVVVVTWFLLGETE